MVMSGAALGSVAFHLECSRSVEKRLMGKTCSLDEARAVKASAAAAFGRLAEVAGVGNTRVGDGYGVKVNLSRPPDTPGLPTEIDGVPIQVEIVGPIRKQNTADSNSNKRTG